MNEFEMPVGLIDGPGICRLLGVTSRQLHAWHSHSDTTYFPQPVATRLPHHRHAVTARSAKLWSAEEVTEWFSTSRPRKGGAGKPKRRRVNGTSD